MIPERHYLIIVLLLIITAIFSRELYFYTSLNQDTINIKNFPLKIGRWTAQELPLNKADLAVLETNNAFLRRYAADEKIYVYLYMAYSQSNPKVINPPEVCYQNFGISILDKGKKSVIISPSNLSIKVNWLLLDNDQNQQIAYYWFKVGGIFTRSYWKQQALAAFNNFIGKKAGNALIRISADIVNGHQQQAIKIINEFASVIGPQLLSLP